MGLAGVREHPGDSRFCATMPSKIAVVMIHTHAVQEGHDFVYFDYSQASMRTTETRVLHTGSTTGYGGARQEAWLLIRKIKGHSEGSRDFVVWFAKFAAEGARLAAQPA